MKKSRVPRRNSDNGRGALQAGDGVAYQLRDTYRALARVFQSETERFGVTVGIWLFLRSLQREGGLTQKELTSRAGLMQPATSAALKQMERRGLVKQTTDPDDRRSVRVHLTSKSRALLDKLVPIAAKVRHLATRDFSERELAMLNDMLARMKSNVEGWRENPRRARCDGRSPASRRAAGKSNRRM